MKLHEESVPFKVALYIWVALMVGGFFIGLLWDIFN